MLLQAVKPASDRPSAAIVISLCVGGIWFISFCCFPSSLLKLATARDGVAGSQWAALQTAEMK
jgi:hypothetical protein